MIGKITKGKTFAPLVKYVLNPDKGARIIATNMCGETPLQLAAELRITEDLNLRVQSPVCHISLSFPVGETVSDEILKAIAGDYLPQMGFDDNPYFMAIHEDTDHFHAHIVTSRIKWSGECVPDWKDYQQSETIIRQLEEKYQLTPVTPSWEVQRTADTTGQIRRVRRSSEQSKSVRRQLQDEIDLITDNRSVSADNLTVSDTDNRAVSVNRQTVSVTELFKQLEAAGIEVEMTKLPQGFGVSFSLDGVNISGTNLGKAYTWNGLQKYKQVNYDPQRDKEAVQLALLRRQKRLSQSELQETILDSQSELVSPYQKRLSQDELQKTQGELLETETVTRNVTGKNKRYKQGNFGEVAANAALESKVKEESHLEPKPFNEIPSKVEKTIANQESAHGSQETAKEQQSTRTLTQRTNPTEVRAINQRLTELISLVGSVSQPEQSNSSRASESESENKPIRASQQPDSSSTDGIEQFSSKDLSASSRRTKSNRRNKLNTQTNHQLDGDTSTEHRTLEQRGESEFERLAELQAAARRSIEQLETGHQEGHSDRDREHKTENQQPSRRNKQPQPKTPPRTKSSKSSESRGFEL